MRLAAAGVLACGGDSNKPTPIEAEGAWSGQVHDNDGSVLGTLSMTLTETSGTVTGNGNISSPTLAEAINVNGTYTEPNLSVSLTSECCNPINLSATVGETTMTGTLNGSGFINATITLTRQ
jgi:hypothetical protein